MSNHSQLDVTKFEEDKKNEVWNEENKLEYNHYIENKHKKKFAERPGDWYCKYCNNLNFSFRNACNRCRLSKFYSY